ncbi:hypothetical protein ElyMa_004051400 [Elysia marginata]|uniref:Uncharacterized protein n=1 Tax=Elysia marginata TaxID=1093978 RepID=A0AAV4G6X3_9GAST|nr:hypothetical protein ElyMa_004051400 [Elysia marginata]
MRQQDCEKKLHPEKAPKNNVNSSPCYSAAEYCAPKWTKSPNTKLVDVKLRESMRTIKRLSQNNIDPVASYHQLNCISPHQKKICDTENNQKN